MIYKFEKANVELLKDLHEELIHRRVFRVKPLDITERWSEIETMDLYGKTDKEDEAAKRAYDVWLEFQTK